MAQRRLTPKDLLRREELGEVALSPDGRRLAYVVKRPRLSAAFHKHEFLSGGDRGDVWLVESSGGEPRNLTKGAEERCGFWAPEWSPDGRRLAMLSTRGGSVGLWVYDLSSTALARALDRTVDLLSTRARAALWVSDERLLVATLPHGERPTVMTVEFQAAETAMQEWPKAWSGEEPTDSVLESGQQVPFCERPQGELVLVDLKSGELQVVMRGFFRDLQISPDRRHVAFSRQVDVFRPKAGERLPLGQTERRRLAVITVEGDPVLDGIEEIEQLSGAPPRWSPDGAGLAVIGRTAGPEESPLRVFRLWLAEGSLEPATPSALDPVACMWTINGGLLVLAGPAHRVDHQKRMEERHWWHAPLGGEPRDLTADVGPVPRSLIPERGLASFAGLAGGDIFRLSVDDGCYTNLTADLEPNIASIVWPRSTDGEESAQLVLELEGESEWRSLDLRSCELRAVPRPTPDSTILELDSERDRAVVRSSDRDGDRLWVSCPTFENATAVAEKNAWLSEIAQGELVRISYMSLDGDELKGWLMLPVDYEEGKRYPLIAEVYPGATYLSDKPSALLFSINGHHSLSPQLLAAHGFAVLFPSMPLEPEAEASDPYLELTKGVLPALDRAVELGFADPARLGVMGQSYGGYATYGLIAQTRRFRAAVALAGLADLVSLYGQFDARQRYEDHPHEHIFQAMLMEAGQLRMGSPPWENAAKYIRNSPLFYVDRVETPLLIIQGDMDYVALQQGEEFFAALYRQAKRARFVRYWGEGHVLQSPANIQSMWRHIYEWFDEHLADATTNYDGGS